MISLSEQLTAQFYRWEQQGRGWHCFEQAVDLEPDFYPFFFHHVPQARQIIDDSKRHTLFSLIGELIKGKPEPPPETYQYEDAEEVRARIFTCDDPLTI